MSRIPTYGYGNRQLVPTRGYGLDPDEGSGDNGFIPLAKKIKKTLIFNLTVQIDITKKLELEINSAIFKKSLLEYDINSRARFIKDLSYNVNLGISKDIQCDFNINAGITKLIDYEYKIKGKSDKRKLIRLLKAM